MKRPLRLLGGRRHQSPVGTGARPTTSLVREAVINFLAPRLPNCAWLDLCSGSGVMSCEALEHGARKVVAIEKNKKTAQICQANLLATSKGLKTSQNSVEVIHQDVLYWLKNELNTQSLNANSKESRDRFDLVYLDPPYDSNLYFPILKALLKGKWLNADSLVVCEHSAKHDLSTPEDWEEKDRRLYGTTALLLINPLLEKSSFDTDSMQPQIDQAT